MLRRGRRPPDYPLDLPPLRIENGGLPALTGTGLCVEINGEVLVEQARTDHDRYGPVWRHADGSVAEW